MSSLCFWFAFQYVNSYFTEYCKYIFWFNIACSCIKLLKVNLLYQTFFFVSMYSIYLGHMNLKATVNLCFQFAMLESVLTGIVDYFPALRSKKTLVMLVISIVFYILGLPMTTPVNQIFLLTQESRNQWTPLKNFSKIYLYLCNIHLNQRDIKINLICMHDFTVLV